MIQVAATPKTAAAAAQLKAAATQRAVAKPKFVASCVAKKRPVAKPKAADRVVAPKIEMVGDDLGANDLIRRIEPWSTHYVCKQFCINNV